MEYPSLTFTLPPAVPKFGPRVGQVTLTRDAETCDDATVRITLDTPNIFVGTSRGVVPHLSRDHTNGSDAIRWISVPFESFLEQVPPIPTLQDGSNPFHGFFGFDKDRHIASLCLRDPLDVREMPPNGNTYVSANCVRGVKKVTLADWRKYVYRLRPDVVFALSDTPFTPPPFSQKRITKSIERSVSWVADLLRPLPGDDAVAPEFLSHSLPRLSRHHPLNVFVHLAGGTSVSAREAFAYGLVETLHGPEAEAVKPLHCLDEGIAGYAFDLAVLRGIRPSPSTSSQHQCLPDGFLRRENSETPQHHPDYPESIVLALTPNVSGGMAAGMATVSMSELAAPQAKSDIVRLFHSSLERLSQQKLRIVTGVHSPHEILRLICDVGIDLFDVGWVMQAAHYGIALDFVFPAPMCDGVGMNTRQPLGHNLYDDKYTHQFGRLADTFAGAGECAEDTVERLVCPCIACSPRMPSRHILHSALDEQSYATVGGEAKEQYARPYSRAYMHHLLHTHEMSVHTFLVAHNLAVVSAFLAGIRHVWVEGGSTRFASEAEKFSTVYDECWELFDAAKKDWEHVDRARGKGRLAREREKPVNDQNDDQEDI